MRSREKEVLLWWELVTLEEIDMQRIRGMIGLVVILSLALAGCALFQDHSDQTSEKTVQTAKTAVTAVSTVHTTDYYGRWVSDSPQVALYLSANQKMAYFQSGQKTITGKYSLKTSKNETATLTQIKFGNAELSLANATSMTLTHNDTTIKLTKDTSWSPHNGEISTDAKVALKSSSLAPAFRETNN